MFVRDPVADGAEGGAVPHLRPRPLRRHQRRQTNGPHRLDRRRLHDDANYAYSQNASTQQVAIGSNLPGSYNYVRNSVKVVIDAYSGKMTFYDVDPKDPILQAYEAAFPHMFTPLSKMPAAAAGAPALPRRTSSRFSRPSTAGTTCRTRRAFYSASNAWQLSPTAGAGPAVPGPAGREHLQQPGPAGLDHAGPHGAAVPGLRAAQHTSQQAFTVSDGFVPAAQTSLSGGNQNFNLTAWMVGQSDPDHYGQLDLYQIPQGTLGPANADAEISADSTVSSDITLLDQKGSEVLLGETLMVPIADSMVYLRPLYVSPTTNSQPQLQVRRRGVGQDRQDRHLALGLADVLGRRWAAVQGARAHAVGRRLRDRDWPVPAVAGILQPAQTTTRTPRPRCRRGNLARYQPEIQAMEQQISSAQDVLRPGPGTGTTTTTTTTPAKKVKKSKRRRADVEHGGRDGNDRARRPAVVRHDRDDPRPRRAPSRAAGPRRQPRPHRGVGRATRPERRSYGRIRRLRRGLGVP